MSRQALLRMLHQRIGLDAESLGERVLNDAFCEARSALDARDDEALYGKVLIHPDAFFEIVESFVVPESWFFRARDQFDDVIRFAREQSQRRPLRVLSLPCASGEEAYSAVIALVEAGLSLSEIEVIGIDISGRAIERACNGLYRGSALRGRALSNRWSQPHAEGFAIADAIRACAQFRVGNALDPAVLDPYGRFDVVFCRNLLIYLHPEARARVLKTLLAALDPPGLLLAGQAEILDTTSGELRPYPGGCPLSYVREAAPSAKASRNIAPPRKLAAAKRTPSHKPQPPPIPHALRAEAELTPQALADAGRLEEARNACIEHLRRHPEDIETLFLLGLVESARSDLAGADAAFAKVSFLDRNHVPAMEHRVALAERLGRFDLAGELRLRAERLRQRHGKPA